MTTRPQPLSYEATNLFNFYIEEYRRTANEINRLQDRLEFLNEQIVNVYNHGEPRTIARDIFTDTENLHTNTRPRRRVVRETRRTSASRVSESTPAPAPAPVQYTQNPITPIQTRPTNWQNLIRTFFNNVTVAPTNEQIENATTQLRYGSISNPINDSCPISLEPFTVDEIVTRIDECGHIFNTRQFETWFRHNVRCPVCRHDIRSIQTNSDAEDIIPERSRPEEVIVNTHNTELLLNLLNNDMFTSNSENNVVMYDASNNILFFETMMHYP